MPEHGGNNFFTDWIQSLSQAQGGPWGRIQQVYFKPTVNELRSELRVKCPNMAAIIFFID
jgi:hypothetical protein